MAGRNFSPFPVLKTERLTLRQLVISDANEVFILRSDEDVNKYLNRQPGKTIEDAKIFIEIIHENIQRNNSIYWAITLCSSDKLVGAICLFDFSEDNLKAEIGYELLPAFQRKGIMQEAVSKVIDYGIKQLGLNSVRAFSHPENHLSTRLLGKLNFKTHRASEGSLLMFTLTSKDVI